MYNVEETVSVQHEIVPGVSVTGGWYHREYLNLRRRSNTGVGFERLHAVHAVQPDRRFADHLLQRERRQGVAAGNEPR